MKLQKIPQDTKHLHYDLKNYCRIWVGKLRIVFNYDIEKQELYLEKIISGHNYRE